MIVDLVQRVFHEKSKGNIGPLREFNQWLQKGLNEHGTTFTNEGQTFSWKIISAEEFSHIISDYETDWMLIHSENLEFLLLGKLYYDYKNVLGQSDNPRLGSFWLFKCQYEGLQVNDEPIHILTPHHFSSPKHRIEPDMSKLISRLRDKKVEIKKYVDYRTHRTDILRIR